MSRKVYRAAPALLAALVAFGCAEAAADHPWFSSGYRNYYYSPPAVRYYYVPVPVYVQPAIVCPTVQPIPYAQPFPAPASQTKEPPREKKSAEPPKVIESKSFSAGDGKGVKVGFWNISGREVTMTVDGKTHVVAADRSLTLVVNREFSWQVAGQPLQKEQVPDDKSAYEIVLR